MDLIIRHLKKSNHILVATHTNPDGDAIGSLIAMGLSLIALNKKTTLYSESPIPAVYRFLPEVHRVAHHINSDDYDLAVILDCGNLQRIGTAVSGVSRIPVIVNIDHHVTNTGFGHFQLIDTSACATAEIIYKLIKQMDIPIDSSNSHFNIYRHPCGYRFISIFKYKQSGLCNQPRNGGIGRRSVRHCPACIRYIFTESNKAFESSP